MTQTLTPTRPRLFSVETANRMLPLVSAIVADLAPLRREVRELRSRIQYLVRNRHQESRDPYLAELRSMEAKLEGDAAQVATYLDELRALGVEFKGPPDGHVGFPAMLDGRLGYLSWNLGETEVNHWMEVDATFPSRQSL